MERNSLKYKWYKIIFEHDTKAGRLFDEILLIIIVLSVMVVMIDSIKPINDKIGNILLAFEWFFTVLFTIEYIIRVLLVEKKSKYIFSFYGIIDFLSIIPTYLSLIYAGTQFLIIIRVVRLLRVFRILKLVRFTMASVYLIHALKHSREKIIVFLGTVLLIVTIMGALMYIVEGPDSGFDSIPRSIYWAIVTITTVGYGDISPTTVTGQFIASILMITGYAIIAVPTGIITAEMSREKAKNQGSKVCLKCNNTDNEPDAVFCKKCGSKIDQRNH
jgi:voltage-gated potassium channel